MLKLGEKREPQRIVLLRATGKEPEAAIVMAPITSQMRRRAQTAVRRMLAEVDDIHQVDADTLGDVGETVSRELIRLGALSWEGIFDANRKPLELTPDRETRLKTANAPDRPTGSIDLLLEEDDLFETLDSLYVRPDALRIAEKNASSALPTGTGGAATRGKGTASSPAARKVTAEHRKTGARSAPMLKTHSTAKRAKRSGRS